MAPCVGLRVQSYCFLSNPPNFFAIIFQKFQQLAKIRRARCCRCYWSVPLARIRMEISHPRHPACRHAPAWRNTGLRTAAIPCRGLRLPRLSTAPPRSACRRKRAQKRRARGHALVTKKFTYYELLFNCLNSFGSAIGEGGYHDVHALKRLE